MADRNLTSRNDDRHLPPPLGVFHHLLKLSGVLMDIVIHSIFIG